MVRISDYDYFIKHFDPVIETDKYGNTEIITEDWEKCKEHMLKKGSYDQFSEKYYDHHYIWTVIHGGSDNWYLSPGIHYVNRIGYVLTNKPWKESQRDLKY